MGKMRLPFTPAVYEHAARMIGRTPWETSRDPELLYAGHSGAHWHICRLVSAAEAAYLYGVQATAIVNGKVIRFRLSPALARAHRENRGKSMTATEAVEFVEAKRRQRALRRAQPYLESRS